MSSLVANEPLAIQQYDLTVEEVVAQALKIQRCMKEVMHEGEHYGVIPGTEKKDAAGNDISKRSLWKSGAEKLLFMFRYGAEFEVTRTFEGPHLDVLVKATLFHIPTGRRVGEGFGSCTTLESKYAYRKSGRVCPECEKPAIIKSKFPPKSRPNEAPGWWCNSKGIGCGADFAANDAAIVGQETGRVANLDVADSFNTVLKIACKRALVAVTLNATAASDFFTQDLDDPEGDPEAQDRAREAAAERQKKATTTAAPEPGKKSDPVAAARADTLGKLFAKKFGAAGDEARHAQAARVVGKPVASFLALTNSEFQLLCKTWSELPDHVPGVPQHPTTPADVTPAEARVMGATVGHDDPIAPTGPPDEDLPFKESPDVPQPETAPILLGDRIAAAAERVGKLKDGKITVHKAGADKLGIDAGPWEPLALVAAGVGQEVLELLEAAAADKGVAA